MNCSILRLLPLALGAAAVLPAQNFQIGLPFAASTTAAGDLFGSAVGVDGTQAVIGAFGHDHNGLITSGGAWIRERTATGSWVETAALIPADIDTQDQFGFAVAITTDRVIVGSKFDDDLGSSSGSAYVFEKQPNGTWLEVQKLTASDGAAGQEFGTTVAIDGDYAVVGCPDGTNGTTPAGAAYVFERQGNGTWLEVAKLAQNDPQNNDDFGWSVSIAGTRIAVGAYLDDDNGPASGSAYVFERQVDGTWPQVAKLLASDGVATDYFGYSVGISGDHVVVGAWLDDDQGSGSGSAYFFERQPDGTWPETAKVSPAYPAAGEHFGQAVAIDGDVAFVGSIHARVNGQSNAGAANFFRRNPDGSWQNAGFVPNPTPDRNDNFAHAVSIGGGVAIAGASQDDEFDAELGAASLFHTYGGYATPTFYGAGTPGCAGPHTLSTTGGLPTIGNAAFGFADTNVPVGLGFLAVGTAADFTGGDPFGLGIVTYVDPVASWLLISIPMIPDGAGNATAPLAMPSDPALAGLQLHAQSVWAWPNCPQLPSALSTSNLASFAITLQ
ncbi:MAG: FG-GAP repeat protein [bacterium]|nr:FG-GAP repeat protein [bacterium]